MAALTAWSRSAMPYEDRLLELGDLHLLGGLSETHGDGQKA
jgi:hypothetical protein